MQYGKKEDGKPKQRITRRKRCCRRWCAVSQGGNGGRLGGQGGGEEVEEGEDEEDQEFKTRENMVCVCAGRVGSFFSAFMRVCVA